MAVPLQKLFRITYKGVMFYGAEPTTQLPPTYSFSGSGPANLTIPIACIVIQSPRSIPGGTSGGTGGTGGCTPICGNRN